MLNIKIVGENYLILETLFYSIKYLARQGIAHHGNNLNQGNLYEIMKMKSRNKPEIIKMINRINESNKTKHLFSSDTKRNVYNVWSFNFKNYCLGSKKSGPLSIMCDGTQYITLEYQKSIVIRYIDKNLKVQEKCIGFYSSTSSMHTPMY